MISALRAIVVYPTLFLVLAGLPTTAQKPVVKWCEVTAPKTARVGDRVDIRVKVTALDGKAFLCCDLKDQQDRMVTWGGSPRAIEQGAEVTWNVNVADAPGITSVHALLYIIRGEKDGWEKAIAVANSPVVEVTGRSPLVDLTYRKSWLWVDVSNGGKPLVSGDTWDVPVDYYLDPADHYRKTTLTIWGAGPWIDTPDGKYTKERGHIGYPGLFASLDIDQAGPGRHVFRFTVPPDLEPVRKNNHVLLIATFHDSEGKEWPWQHRVETSFVRKRGFFEIESTKPGNLFTYGEPVRLWIRLKNVTKPGEARTLHYTVRDTSGAIAAEGTKDFTVTTDGQRLTIDLKPAKRGVFLIEADVPGWEKRRTTFARIPDTAAARAAGGPNGPIFGMTSEVTTAPEEVWAVANRLGLSVCRRFVPWYRVNPGPGIFKLDEVSNELDTARKHGVREWLCIGDPPPFAFPGKPTPVSYNAFDFREDVWRDFVRTATTRFKGRFVGWEWLNEITPGGCDDPVGIYLKMCRTGVETAKAVDPGLVSILAGGLWPRSFRNSVLAAGIGKYVDALPIHYQSGDGVQEAREDLEAVGRSKVAVWEDESAKGVNAWTVPPVEEMRNTDQCEWVLRQWTDELAAGCRTEIYFGGRGDAAGSWDYLLDDLHPRPVAATLAVLVSKLSGTKPLGMFREGSGGLFHLFERAGKPILVASTTEAGHAVPLRVGAERLTLTDYQGNETTLAARGGVATIPVARLPFFVEGADLDTLKAYAVPDIAVARVGEGTGAGVGQAAHSVPHAGMLRGAEGRLAVRLRNLYDRPLAGTLTLQTPSGWPALPPQKFALAAGKEEVREMPVRVPALAETTDYPVNVAVRFADKRLPAIQRPVVLTVISADMLGNLMPNGDFETPNAAGTGPEGFTVNGTTSLWAPAEGLHEGLGKRVIEFRNSSGWESAGRTIPVRGGQTYLYTAWVRNHNMEAGSNMTLRLLGGREIQLFNMQVIACGQNNPYWQVFTCRKETPPDTEQVSFIPLANGPGWATFDNVRVTLFEGSDYAAEAFRATTPPKMDGTLDGWIKKCPIPLIGRNQLTFQSPGYEWTPDNLSAVGYMMWDQANLYVAVSVRDDVHHAVSTSQTGGSAILDGDSVVIAIDPTRGGPSAMSRSFEYYLSSAAPGGGSGKHTLFRPPDHSGGRPSGHLARDSSIYDLAVVPGQGGCIYELRIPLSELGIQGVTGAKIGLSLQLNDNDGAGKVAQMNWGGGLYPTWNPRNFGIVTLVE